MTSYNALEAYIVEWTIFGCPPHRFLVLGTQAALMDAETLLEGISGLSWILYRAEDLDVERELDTLWVAAHEALASTQGGDGSGGPG